ncbi:MAG: helix-turn-helix transcriptional regulator [Coriobacteriales bacterium]|jgi:DNA-binding CsgD family transcriptional regulator
MERGRGEGFRTARKDLGWLAVAALGLACCLMANGVYDGTISGRISSVAYGGVITTSPWSGGVSVIATCLAMAVAIARSHREPRPRLVACLCLAACMGVSLTALLCLGEPDAGADGLAAHDDGPASVAWGMLLSAAATVLLALWVQALAHEGRTLALRVLSAALLLDTAMSLVIQNALVSRAGDVAMVLAVVAAPLLYLRFLGMRATSRAAACDGGAGRGEGDGKGADGPVPGAQPGDRRDAPDTAGARKAAGLGTAGGPVLARSSYDIPFWLSVALIAIYSFAMGNIQSLGSGSDLTSGFAQWVFRNSVSLTALVVAVVAALVAPMREPHGMLRVAILVVLMFAVYLAVALGRHMEPFGVLSMTLVRMLIVLYIWLLACDIPWRNGWQVYVFGIGWGTFTACNALSTRIGLALGQAGPARDAYDLAAVACLAALVVIELAARRAYADGFAGVPGADAVAAAPSPAGSRHPGASGAKPARDVAGAPGEAAEDPALPQCRSLARAYGLTSRELDVLVPLVHGRSAATIARMLDMSTETARTHIRHIYQKTDIHNREDLMDAVEAQPAGGAR